MPCLPRQSKRPGGSMFLIGRICRNRARPFQLRSASLAGLSLLAIVSLADSPSIAQVVEQGAQGSNQLPPIDVRAPRPPQRRSTRAARPTGQPLRATRSPAPVSAPQPPQTAGPGGTATPLDTDTVATSASRLGLTVRETPATVEVIDQQTIQDRGFRTVSETAQGAAGVTAGDFPAEPSAFSMRGFTNSQINTLYNGIRTGPQNMTSRVMDSFNLQQVEFLKGPASLMSGEGAAGGAVNFVTKQPHTGPINSEAFLSYDSFGTRRAGIGSGGSTGIQGLDYRFDLSRSAIKGFIDNTHTNTWDISTQFNYRASETFKAFVAFEHKQDSGSAYWGTPLVSSAFSGPFALNGIVSGNYTSFYNGTNLGPVTIDSRTLKTNYNVLDNRNKAEELWLRGRFEWMLTDQVTLRTHAYAYNANREWFNNEISAFNAALGLVDRERFFVAHDQKLYGDMTDLTWNSNIAGMDNRAVAGIGVSRLEFARPGAANFPHDLVTLVNPNRGFYGPLTTQLQPADIDNIYLTFEDRLKITRTFSFIGGVRAEQLALERTSAFPDGTQRPGFPFSKNWEPVTGRVGYTWEAIPGLTFYSQYGTGADVAANTFSCWPQ